MRRLAEGYFQLKPLGPARIKGVNEPIELFEVTGLGPLRTRLQVAARRGFTKFVGREPELAQMRRALELAREGHGQVVAAMGDPGVGKSRLFFEFKAVAQSRCLVLEAYSVSHGKASAYLPVIDLLKSYFEIASEDDELKRREKVNGKIITLDRALEDTLPYLFGLLGIVEDEDPLAQLDPQLKRRRTLDAIKRILTRESLRQPLIVDFEDLHWIDSETQALLNLIVDALATAHILLLVNYRPEYHHQWGNKTYYTQLRLDPLGRQSADQMLTALLGEGVVELASLKRLIIERTEGNPFFMEEMVQALFEQGVLVRNGAVKLAKPLDQIRVPATVQAILASRIDRLAAGEKELLQTLAVLGREFSAGLIKRVAGKSDDELEGMLSDLQFGEFIYEQPAIPDIEYIFKHALTQEVAYNSLLVERRRLLHERAAEAIEALFAQRLDDHVTELAHHYDRSGNVSKAVQYLGRAGNRAAQQMAFSEAAGHLSRALELLKQLPEGVDRDRQELDLQTYFGVSLYMSRGPGAPQAETAALRRLELSEQLGDEGNLKGVLLSLTSVYIGRREFPRAQEVAERALAMTQRADEQAAAHSQLANVLFIVGQFDGAREHLERALEFPERARGVAGEIAPSILPTVLLLLGFPAAAIGKGRDSVASARELPEPVSLARALVNDSMRHALLRDSRIALERAEEVLSIATRHEVPFYEGRAHFCRGWAMAAAGQGEEGIAEMQRSVAAFASAGALVPLFLAMLAESLGRNGHPAEALATVADALARVEQTGERMAEAGLYGVKGELLLMCDPCDEVHAERCFRSAIDIARRAKARFWELRATMSLARLLKRQGKRDESCSMLSEIYNWFTEGFDCADLKDARALLEELVQ